MGNKLSLHGLPVCLAGGRCWIILQGGNVQTTLSKLQYMFLYHIIGFHWAFFSKKPAASAIQANWDTGKIPNILSIMHGKCPSCCGAHEQLQTFQQLLLWSHFSLPIILTAKVAPSLLHLIWAENDRQGSQGSLISL